MTFSLIEGFFGPAWSWTERRSLAGFLRRYGFGAYFYAPKVDPYLRKRWQEAHPPEMWAELQILARTFESAHIEFGVGLSPFELHNELTAENKQIFRDNVARLTDLGIGRLGIFLDDMKGGADLAARQAEICELARSATSVPIFFCPTYYSPDPVLDRVFGARPAGYVEDLGRLLPPEIDILWTGEKVISPEISAAHLRDVAKLLRRKPFVWDNLFANDGPRQCAYLKLKPVAGRTLEAAREASGWTLNPMNQFELSKIAALSFMYTLEGRENPVFAAIEELCDKPLAGFIVDHTPVFCDTGLKAMEPSQVQKLQTDLTHFKNPAAAEISRWLAGDYNVGSECLTD